jgi:D-alanyl-lipoteichoic acid acyltransferase DltB (MBOAT superfamily)
VSIFKILIMAAAAIPLHRLPRGRTLAIAAVSAFGLFWLASPDAVIPALPFLLQTLTLLITILVWFVVTPKEERRLRQEWPAFVVIAGAVLLAVLVQHSRFEQVLAIPTLALPYTVVILAAFAVLIALVSILSRFERALMGLAAVAMILIFIVLKSPALTHAFFTFVTSIRGRTLEPDPSKPLTLAWLGYSYIAFRLLHVIRDRQTGVLTPVGLSDFICYVIFFPSISAGPIDRVERFSKDLAAPAKLSSEDWLFAGQRLALGLFKKFVLADWLAWLSISDALTGQVHSAAWLWVFLYAYAFRIYFDFSGYTDIAIGTARLMGVHLPENFASPYLKPNLTQFWNSWHITLTQWFRAYFFNPVTRSLRTMKRPLPMWLILLLTQFATMTLIGLWHGITWNFALWGVWHAAGLFIQNRWSEFVRVRFPQWGSAPRTQRWLNICGILLTFHYVALGWVFFALSTPQASLTAFMKLFGIA